MIKLMKNHNFFFNAYITLRSITIMKSFQYINKFMISPCFSNCWPILALKKREKREEDSLI